MIRIELIFLVLTSTCPVCLSFTDGSNIQWAMTGFDPYMADPNKYPDPGMKSQIFEPFTELVDGRVQISPFIAKAFNNQPCTKDFNTASFINYEQYVKSKMLIYSIDKEADEDLMDAVLRHTEKYEYNEIKRFFQENVGEILSVSSECIAHTVEIATFVTPTFTHSFRAALKSLHFAAKDPSSPKSADAFVKFVESFGTHYLKKTFLGTKIIFDKLFLQRSVNKEVEYCRKQCLRTAAHTIARIGISDIVAIEAYFSEESQSCSTDDNECLRDANNYFEGKGLVTSFGLSHGKDFESFAKNGASSVPIAFELEPLSSLFSNLRFSVTSTDHENLSGELFDGNSTSAFFDTMREQYCTLILGGKCTTESMKGCGLNSLCSPTQLCVNDASVSLGYQCHERPAGQRRADGLYYLQLDAKSVNYEQAVIECRKIPGYRLAIARTRDTMRVLHAISEETGQAWLGLTRHGSTYSWHDGSRYNNAQLRNHLLNNQDGTHYVMHEGKLDDVGPGATLPPLCQANFDGVSW